MIAYQERAGYAGLPSAQGARASLLPATLTKPNHTVTSRHIAAAIVIDSGQPIHPAAAANGSAPR